MYLKFSIINFTKIVAISGVCNSNNNRMLFLFQLIYYAIINCSEVETLPLFRLIKVVCYIRNLNIATLELLIVIYVILFLIIRSKNVL